MRFDEGIEVRFADSNDSASKSNRGKLAALDLGPDSICVDAGVGGDARDLENFRYFTMEIWSNQTCLHWRFLG